MSGPPRIALALGLVAAVAVAVIAALLTVGGPGTARLERLDERRASDLAELVEAIERYRAFAGRLPESPEELPGQVVEGRGVPSGLPWLRDPQTGEPYEYEVLGEGRFRVCARLSLPEAPPPRPEPIRIPESRRITSIVPDPKGGRLCLETAEPPG